MLDGFKPIPTQIFDVVVKFVKRKDDSKAEFKLKYDISMVPNDEIGESEPLPRSSGIGSGG